MSSLSWEAARLAALVVVFAPILVLSLRSGNLPNWSAAVVLVTGLALGLTRAGLAEAPWLFWIIGTVVWIAFSAFADGIGGGVVKVAIAFLPWFHDAGEYLLFITIAMGLAAGGAFLLRRQKIPIAPCLMIAGLGMFTFAAVG